MHAWASIPCIQVSISSSSESRTGFHMFQQFRPGATPLELFQISCQVIFHYAYISSYAFPCLWLLRSAFATSRELHSPHLEVVWCACDASALASDHITDPSKSGNCLSRSCTELGKSMRFASAHISLCKHLLFPTICLYNLFSSQRCVCALLISFVILESSFWCQTFRFCFLSFSSVFISSTPEIS